MRNNDQILLENIYVNMYAKNYVYPEYNSDKTPLIENSLSYIDTLVYELISEGMFGDFASKVKNITTSAKEKVSKALDSGKEKLKQVGQNIGKLANTAKEKIFQPLIQKIFSMSDNAEKVLEIIASGKLAQSVVDYLKKLLGKSSVKKESYEDHKSFLAEFLFTENNIKDLLLESMVLSEARRKPRPAGEPPEALYTKKPKTKAAAAAEPEAVDNTVDVDALVDKLAKAIKKQYSKNEKGLTSDYSKIIGNLNSKLGISSGATQPQASSEQSKQQGSSVASSIAKQAQTQPQAQTQGQPPQQQGATSQQAQSQQQATQAQAAPQQAQTQQQDTQQQAQQQQGGFKEGAKRLIDVVKGFIKEHPRISAGVGAGLIVILAFAFFGSAHITVPGLILGAAKGAGISGASNLILQKFKGEKLDYKKAAKAALVGGALGGVGSILSAGLSSIGSALSSVIGSLVHGGGGAAHAVASGGDHGATDQSHQGGNNTHSNMKPIDPHHPAYGQTMHDVNNRQKVIDDLYKKGYHSLGEIHDAEVRGDLPKGTEAKLMSDFGSRAMSPALSNNVARNYIEMALQHSHSTATGSKHFYKIGGRFQ